MATKSKIVADPLGRSWEYHGVTIKISDHGHFYADPAGQKRLTGPSLDSVRKKIDDLRKVEFEPFDIIDIQWPSQGDSYRGPKAGKYAVRKVIGIERDSRGMKFQLAPDEGKTFRNSEVSNVIPNTPRNIARVKQALDLTHEHNLMRYGYDQQEKTLLDSIEKLDVESYMSGDKTPKATEEE
jgi:hypothetical protein